MDEQLLILAKHRYTVFHNKENGYTVAKFVTIDENEKDFVVVGFFHEIDANFIYELKGQYVEHKKYGLQFQVESYELSKTKDKVSLVRYFSSAYFPGIGKKIAEAIVDTLGLDCIQLIKENPDILLSVRQLTDKKRDVIKEVLFLEEKNDVHAFFTSKGLSVKNILKLEAIYGEQVIHIVEENPYRIIEEVDGIGFKTVDKLAKEMSFDMNHPYRIKAAILSIILDLCIKSGDTYLYKEEIEKKVIKMFPDIDVREYLNMLQEQKLIYIEQERIYHHTQYESEKGIVDFLYEFPLQTTLPIYTDIIRQDITWIENELQIVYDEIQKKAIENFFLNPFSILTGGPGTGKTTVVQAIIQIYKKHFPTHTVACCAPTGRAAKRLTEITLCPSTTIHSLLKWDLENNKFGMNEKEPLDIDILIIDEFSMVDQWLFYHLLSACTWVKKILIIGDDQQLPSVGCGNVLKDLMSSQVFPVTILKKIFRQKEESHVIQLAHHIREQSLISIEEGNDLTFIQCESVEVKENVKHIIQAKLSQGLLPKDIQVLAPMYQGVAGIDVLNKTIQQIVYEFSDESNSINVGYRTFKVKDKVLQLKNQPEDGIYNGDIGEIIDIVDDAELNLFEVVVDFDGTVVSYGKDGLINLTHAFCISIHKAQGSEYPLVIMPIVKEHSYMLDRRLLYTGITRASKELILIGNQEMFFKAVQRNDKQERKTYLKEKIIKKFE